MRWRSGVLAAAITCLAVVVQAAPSSGLGGENLLQTMPQGFKVGFRTSPPGLVVQEMVPEAETVEDWTRMITTQVFLGRGDAPVQTFIVGFGQMFSNACPGTTQSPPETGVSNGYPTASLVLECPSNPATGKPENVYVKMIAGKDSLYMVQMAYRSAVDNAEKKRLFAYLESITACDARSDAHPCPDLAAEGFERQ